MVTQLGNAACDAAMWTAPVLFNIRGAGLGLTLGYTTIDSLLLIDSEEAFDAYYKTQVCWHRACPASWSASRVYDAQLCDMMKPIWPSRRQFATPQTRSRRDPPLLACP